MQFVHANGFDYVSTRTILMGWLWDSGKSADAQDQLDPSLCDFLKKEAPSGPKPTLPSPPKEKPAETSQTQSAVPEKPAVPPQSQFQDGRYVHLWKNYTPQDVLNDRGKNEQDRLRDLVDAYNDRRASIGRVATENCALEYMEQFECFRHPSTWWSAGTMCNAESRRFNRCYDMQSKFLKALGYMTMDARTPEEDERIQMHADKLYQQMLQQEAEIEKAKAEGRPVPKFESVLSKQNVANAMGRDPSRAAPVSGTGRLDIDDENDIWSRIKPESRREYEKKLAALPPAEREVERMAVLGELKASTGMAKQVEETFVEERIQRMKRREAGQATFGDTIKQWWGWG
ncbi:Nn.00g037160.m01.CDS01 [Neocucurbitaria sp. VM-36]